MLRYKKKGGEREERSGEKSEAKKEDTREHTEGPRLLRRDQHFVREEGRRRDPARQRRRD